MAEPARDHLELEEFTEAEPVAATGEMPPELQKMLDQNTGPFVRSTGKPKIKFDPVEVPGVPGLWRVFGAPQDDGIQNVIPGKEQQELDPAEPTTYPAATEMTDGNGYRPPWVPVEYLPRLAPFRVGEEVFFEPRPPQDVLRVGEAVNRLSFPFRTVGIVRNSNGKQGSGVLVGPNLLLTAGHVAPWGSSSWWMEFIPAFRAGDPRPPFGSSFVEAYRGFNTGTEVSGKDYVICKLYNPLGNALGWLGRIWHNSEDPYYRGRYVSMGYPGTYQGRPAVEFDMGIRDIDSDSPGIELEFAMRPDLGPGWSGGPLWLPMASGVPAVVAVFSGHETDELDPRRAVFGGGRAMVDLVNFGLANWRP